MSEMAIDHAGWGPPVISWFINQYNLHELVRFYQKPSFFSHLCSATEPYQLGAPSSVKSSILVPKKKPGARGNKPKALELANRALELARRAEDGNVEGRVLGVMELIKGALVIPHKVVPHS
jgi:hypothetical protein